MPVLSGDSGASTPRAATTSSALPSAATAVERIVWLMVSPVARAAAMIVVPEHRAGDDQGCARRASPGVADAEPEEHAVARREYGDHAERDAECSREDERDVVDRESEELVHARPLPESAAGASAMPTS